MVVIIVLGIVLKKSKIKLDLYCIL